jgi:hypothetical protein
MTTTAARLIFLYAGETGAKPSFPLTVISTAARKTRWVPPVSVLFRVRVWCFCPDLI